MGGGSGLGCVPLLALGSRRGLRGIEEPGDLGIPPGSVTGSPWDLGIAVPSSVKGLWGVERVGRKVTQSRTMVEVEEVGAPRSDDVGSNPN